MDGGSDDGKKWKEDYEVRCRGCDGVFLVAQPECLLSIKMPPFLQSENSDLGKGGSLSFTVLFIYSLVIIIIIIIIIL